MEFFRFPHTPHLAWLGAGVPRDDKVLSPEERREFLAHDLIVEEKVDGANLGISLDVDGQPRVQNRGTYLAREYAHPQFKPLFRWLDERAYLFQDALGADLILFGEWLYAVHSVRYTQLPDWFLAFDVYDRAREEFWSTARRDALAQTLGLSLVPRLGQGAMTLERLREMLAVSRVSDAPAEGLYVRWEDAERLVRRAKLVRPEFTQAIGEHWSRRNLQTNELSKR